MKYLLITLSTLLLASCTQNIKKEFVTLSGTIINKNSDSIVLSSKEHKYSKTIQVNEDGTFRDTLKITAGLYQFYDGGESSILFLKNGYDLSMTLNTEQFDETISYQGEGSENSNFLAEKSLLEEKLFDFEIDTMSKEDLDEKMKSIATELTQFIAGKNGLDTTVVDYAAKGIEATIKSYSGYLGDLITLRTNLPKGAPSPVFSNYENHAGGTMSLTDLKGKYVYIDVWATWCGPCKAEIPYLKEVEADFHDQNIEFVSVSIDRPKDYEKWISMVTEKELGGVQLYADKNWESKWVQEYFIKGIPRFILVDPAGNIVSPDAPRPSNPELRTLLEELM